MTDRNGRSEEDYREEEPGEYSPWDQAREAGRAEEWFRVMTERTTTVTVTVTVVAEPTRTGTSMDRGRPPPPALRRERKRSSSAESSMRTYATTATTKSTTLPTPTATPTLKFMRPRAITTTSIPVPYPVTYEPYVNNSPADSTASDDSYSSTTIKTTTSSSPSASVTTTASATSCTGNCYLPVQVDERVLPIRYTQGSDGYWTRDNESWVIYGRVSTVVTGADEGATVDDIAAAAAAAVATSDETVEDEVLRLNATSVVANGNMTGNATVLDTTTTVGEAYEILATLPKGWGSTSERSAVYRVPLIIVASMVLALIMVAFIVIVIVNRSKARRRQARRKRRAARLAAAAAAKNGIEPNITGGISPPTTPGNKLSRLSAFRSRRRGDDSASAVARGQLSGAQGILDDDDSDDTSSLGLSEKVGAGLRRRRGGNGRSGLRWRIKREREVVASGREGADGDDNGVGRGIGRETLIIEGGTGSKGLFKEKVVRWRAGMRKRRNVAEGDGAEGDRGVVADNPSAEVPGPPAMTDQSPLVDPDVSSLPNVEPSSHDIETGPTSGTTPDTSYITAPVHPTFFLPAYRAASVHNAEASPSAPVERHDAQDRPVTPPPEIGTSAAGASGSSYLAGGLGEAGSSAEGGRAFEKSPARYYAAPTTTEQEEALGIAFGVGVGGSGVEAGRQVEEEPLGNVGNGPITGHLATDDKRLLERLRNAGSGPSAGAIPRADGSAPVLDVDEDGFERHHEQLWEPSEPEDVSMGNTLRPLGLPEPPRAISQPSYAAFASGPSEPSAPGMMVEGGGDCATPSAPAMFDDEVE